MFHELTNEVLEEARFAVSVVGTSLEMTPEESKAWREKALRGGHIDALKLILDDVKEAVAAR